MSDSWFPLRSWRSSVPSFSGVVNRHQADVIAYLVEENRVLKEQLRGHRLRLTDDQRRRLAAKGKILAGNSPVGCLADSGGPQSIASVFQSRNIGRPNS